MSNPVYLIAQIEVKNHESYLAEYGFPLLEQLAEIGAEVLAADYNYEVLEGRWPGNWTAIIRFPNRAVMSAFYHSEKYAPLKALRIDKLSEAGAVIALPGLHNIE
jgi:uncharacterized protein (DUF1330 family)